MPKQDTSQKSSYRKALERKAERIIKATGKYPEAVRSLVSDTLKNRPNKLRYALREIERMHREAEERVRPIAAGAHEFSSKAYSAALEFYYANHDKPAKLDRALRALTV